MNSKTMTKLDWMMRRTRLERASAAAEEIVEGYAAPIDPFAIARNEGQALLRIRGEDFGDAFDGHLRYHQDRQCFVMLYNTKYDVRLAEGHHPRTRFSVAHELGHYFLDKHRAYLMGGGEPHESRSEFKSDMIVEQEADAFAAALMMPAGLARPLVNEAELTLAMIHELSTHFGLSQVSTSLRAVRLSDFPCAVAGIRDGLVSWCTCSQRLIEAGFYPPEKSQPKATTAQERWAEFAATGSVSNSGSSFTKEWFGTYNHVGLDHYHVDEHYLAVPIMSTLVVLLSIPEDQFDCEGDD